MTCLDAYRAIRNDPSKLVLQHSLARLLLKLGQVRPATSLLDKCLEAHKAREEAGRGTNLEALMLDVDTYVCGGGGGGGSGHNRVQGPCHMQP